MEGFLANVVKYLLFATNFAIFIIGCVVLGIGIYALVDGESLVNIVNNSGADITIQVYTSAAVILITVSVFIVILTFFGCCGAIKESKCMLGTYFTLILVMFVVMIVGAVIGYSQSMDEIQEALEKSMVKFKDENDPNYENMKPDEKAVTDAWNTIQGDFECCGTVFGNKTNKINSWEIHNSDTYPTSEGYRVPGSCCTALFDRDNTTGIEMCRKNPFDYNMVGCFDEIRDTFDSNKNNILIVGVTIVVIMFLNMLFAFAMCTMAN